MTAWNVLGRPSVLLCATSVIVVDMKTDCEVTFRGSQKSIEQKSIGFFLKLTGSAERILHSHFDIRIYNYCEFEANSYLEL